MNELINGKTPEQIKEALCVCTSEEACNLYGCYYSADNNCRDSLMRDALELIKRLEAERDAALANVPKWISVEDRLPDADDWVAVRYRDKEDSYYPTAGYYFKHTDGQMYWATDVDNSETAYPPEEITHWMPLPELAKEENNGDNNEY